ncbi:MAG: PAS domain S-box protein, partial [Calditrichaeota bacterium]
MPASPNELWWVFVVGTGVFLSLAVGIIAIVVLNQRRLLLAQREKMDALRKSEEEYSDLFHNVSDIVYIHSLDGTLLRVNARMCMFLGRTEEELVGKSVKQILAPKHHARFDRYLKEIVKDGESNGFLILTSKDGKENLFEYRNSLVIKDGKPVAVRGIARNVTEQKKAERALRESEERFRRLIKFSPVPIAVHSHGRWAYVNDAAVKLVCASSPEEIIGRPVLEFFKGENRKNIRKQIRSSLVAGNEVSIIVEKLHRLDGKEIEVEVVAIPIVYGGKRGGQVVVRDVTEQKRLQDELARAQRLETAGRIAGQIAHDFNNLLAPLTAYPTLIREDLPEDHPAVELVNDMEAAAEKIAEINQQLLTLGRRGHYAMEPVDLNDLARKVVASQAFPQGIVVNQELGKDLLPINGGKA